MEVVRVRTEENHIRYYLADDDGLPVEPVLRFLKSKTTLGMQGTHCVCTAST